MLATGDVHGLGKTKHERLNIVVDRKSGSSTNSVRQKVWSTPSKDLREDQSDDDIV